MMAAALRIIGIAANQWARLLHACAQDVVSWERLQRRIYVCTKVFACMVKSGKIWRNCLSLVQFAVPLSARLPSK